MTSLTIGTPILAKLTSASTVPTSTYVQYPNPQKNQPCFYPFFCCDRCCTLTHFFGQYSSIKLVIPGAFQCRCLPSNPRVMPCHSDKSREFLISKPLCISSDKGPVFLISNPICICSGDSRLFQILKTLCISSGRQELGISHLKSTLCFLGQEPSISHLILYFWSNKSQVFRISDPFCNSSDKAWVFLILKPLFISLSSSRVRRQEGGG